MKIKRPAVSLANLSRAVGHKLKKLKLRHPRTAPRVDSFEPRVSPRHPQIRPVHARPVSSPNPDTFTVTAGPNGVTCGGTPAWNPHSGLGPTDAPLPKHPAEAPKPKAGGGCTASNPFEGNKGLSGTQGPYFTLGKPDASTTWDQLAQLFAEGKVIGDTGGSCGMTSAQKHEALRSFWDQCVQSGKSPAECGFYVRCGPNVPPGLTAS